MVEEEEEDDCYVWDHGMGTGVECGVLLFEVGQLHAFRIQLCLNMTHLMTRHMSCTIISGHCKNHAEFKISLTVILTHPHWFIHVMYQELHLTCFIILNFVGSKRVAFNLVL